MNIRIPRTFVFDKNIREDDYHLYIDPEEYYHEEFDASKEDFQNYRKKKDLRAKVFVKKNRQNKPITMSLTESVGFFRKKNPEYSLSLDENDPINVMIEKTRRTIRKNQIECAQIKRRVNDDNFGNDYKNNKNSIRKTNMALESVFNDNDFLKLMTIDQDQDELEKDKEIKGGFILRQFENTPNMTNTRKKLTSPGYQMKLIENFHSYNNNNFTQNIKKKKSPKKKVNHKESEDLLKINAEMKKIEKSSDLYKLSKTMGVFPDKINELRMNSHKYVNLSKAEKKKQFILTYQDVKKKLTNSPRNLNRRSISKFNSSSLNYSTNILQNCKNLKENEHKLNKDDQKMLIYIKDVLTKPMNEGNVIVSRDFRTHEQRLLNLKRKNIQPEKLNFFSLDKRIWKLNL